MFVANAATLSRLGGGLGADAVAAYEAALAAVEPGRLLSRALAPLGPRCVSLLGRRLCGPVYLAGFGKMARGMAEAAHRLLGDRLEAGVVIAPRGQGGRVGPVEILEGDHPVPRGATLSSSRRLLDFISSLPGGSVLLVAVSGGGSSLFEIPAPGLEMSDVAETARLLMDAGADIYELNAVRKHLSRVKGGQLLRYIRRGVTMAGLYVSDVPGDRLDTIASGPTVPDPTTFRDAYEALQRRKVWKKTPPRARAWIEAGLRGEAPETPKPGDPLFAGTVNTLLAGNRDALHAAAGELRRRGYSVLVLTDTLRGEAREAARVLASMIEGAYRGLPGLPRPAAIVAGGETTVTVRGGGIGGRNQELCLALALALHRLRLAPRYLTLCAGSDGVDGVSPAAGAVVDEATIDRALQMGLDPEDYLERNDSYSFFKALGQAVDTRGYTGINVNDIFIALIP